MDPDQLASLEASWSGSTLFSIEFIYGPRQEKTCLWWFVNNKGAGWSAHPHSLISAFVIHVLESIIYRLAMSKISMF